MQIKVKKCGSCDIGTNKGKYWRTGTWLCDKCYMEWTNKDKELEGDTSKDDSVSESIIKKIKKGRNIKRRKSKNVKTKIHENGFQSRLDIS